MRDDRPAGATSAGSHPAPGSGDRNAIYAQAMLAAGLLIERRGVPALVAYFQRFAESSDRLANFRQAFGEDLSAFDQVFRAYLDTAVR